MIFIKKIKIKKDYEPFTTGDEFVFKSVNMLVGDQGCGKSTLLSLLNRAKNKFIIGNKVLDLCSDDERIKKSAAKIFNPTFMQDKNVLSNTHDGVDIYVDKLFDEYDNIFDIDYIPEFNGNAVFFDTEQHNPRVKYTEYESKRPLLQELSLICREIHKAVQNERDKRYVREIFEEYASKASIQKQDIDGFIINSHKSHGETILPMLAKLVEFKNCVILLDEPETSLSVRSQFKLTNIINQLEDNGNQLFIATHSSILMQSQELILSLEHRQWITPDDFIKN